MVLVIDLCKIGKNLPENLIKMLVSANWIKTGIDVTNDMRYLSFNYELGVIGGIFDIKQIAQICDNITPNLINVYSQLYNTEYIKNTDVITCDWSDELTMKMINYCAEDAYLSYKIGKKIIENITKTFLPILKTSVDKLELRQNIVIENVPTNWIGKIQEYAQQNNYQPPVYTELDKDNDNFIIMCEFNKKQSYGKCKSKKSAKQKAARNMYQLI